MQPEVDLTGPPAGSEGERPDGVPEEVARLRAEHALLLADNARLRRLAETNAASARLQGERAAEMLGWGARNEATLRTLYASTFWQLTAPLRAGARLIGGAPVGARSRSITALLRADGWRATGRKALRAAGRARQRVARRLASRLGRVAASRDGDASVMTRPIGRPAAQFMAPRVLIVAELTVPQCAKYRVWQRREVLKHLGTACTVADWRSPATVRSALQACALAIFYRTPGTPEVLGLIAEARRLGVPSWWEVDDAIMDEAIYRANRNLLTLPPAVQENLLDGVRLYRAAMLACDGAIASTPALANAMRSAGMARTLVIENGLDAETMDAAAAAIAAASRPPDGVVRIVYGSGTRTHDVDFALVGAALARVMEARPEIVLRIVGEIALPPELGRFADRVERLPSCDFRTWLRLLAECDIALAPLDQSVFNDAKSSIKFLEAAIVGLPCICSPREAFRAAVAPGETGLLAEGEADWFRELDRLAEDPSLRRRMGAAARRSVLARFAPDAIAREQVAPLIAGLHRREKRGLRVLAVNVFFWPRSFGGATVVAEEMASRLHSRTDAEMHVFTSHPESDAGEYGLQRYERDGMPIYSVAVSAMPDEIGAFDNPAVGTRFAEVLRAVEPDVVHLHSVQGISASVAAACQAEAVPYVVTVHDAWWLCARQFMVRGDGRYCFQTTIDLNMCRACVPGASFLGQRQALLQDRLHGAALVLSPGRSHAALHLANGLPPAKLRVHPNGVRLPTEPRAPRPRGERLVRFGYVGGTPAVKGFAQLRRAVEGLAQANWRLTLVDNTLNLGFASIETSGWKLRGEIVVRPAYRQDEMDAFFGEIDVLLFPSQWRESFGLTLREALARDVWVIATDCGGPVEDLVDGVNGTVVPMDGRHEALQAAMAALLDAPDRLASYRNPHKARLRSFAEQADELFELLSEATEMRGAAASTRPDQASVSVAAP